MKQRKVYITILLFFCTLLSSNTRGQAEKEYPIKAGFFEKFAQFCQWPEQEQSPYFDIVILGKNPFGKILEVMYQNTSIKNRTVRITYASSVTQIQNAQMVYISSSESKKLDQILSYLKNKPILTVGDTRNYCEKGVMINFYNTPKHTIHFEINQNQAKEHGLKFDYLLLSYAKIIDQ